MTRRPAVSLTTLPPPSSSAPNASAKIGRCAAIALARRFCWARLNRIGIDLRWLRFRLYVFDWTVKAPAPRIETTASAAAVHTSEQDILTTILWLRSGRWPDGIDSDTFGIFGSSCSAARSKFARSTLPHPDARSNPGAALQHPSGLPLPGMYGPTSLPYAVTSSKMLAALERPSRYSSGLSWPTNCLPWR